MTTQKQIEPQELCVNKISEVSDIQVCIKIKIYFYIKNFTLAHI